MVFSDIQTQNLLHFIENLASSDSCHENDLEFEEHRHQEVSDFIASYMWMFILAF